MCDQCTFVCLRTTQRFFAGESLHFSIVMPSNVYGLNSMQKEENMKNLLEYITSIGENEFDYNGRCDVAMPKFKLDFDYDLLKEHLIKLGIILFKKINSFLDCHLETCKRIILVKCDKTTFKGFLLTLKDFSLNENKKSYYLKTFISDYNLFGKFLVLK